MAGGEPSPKRERILDAAEQIFARRGFHGARVTDVARSAKVADGTIYLYFKNKDDLLVSLFEERMEEINTRIREILEELPAAADRMLSFAEYYVGLAESRSSLAEVLSVELRASSKFMKEYRNVKFVEFLSLLALIIKQGQADGTIRPDINAEVVARSLFGALDELMVGFVLSKRPIYNVAEATRQVVEVFWAGLAIPRRES